MSASVAVIARSMHREAMSLMDEMNARKELMSRKESDDAFFSHHYITPKIIDSKIITRNINALYIDKKPMTNRPVARTRRRQRAVFHCAMLCYRPHYGAPYKDVSMETYRREESPRFLGGFYVRTNFDFMSRSGAPGI